jgi:nucleoside-diphosphate-sugar epimerase
MAHYLITGAAGFIAARTAGLLLDAGHQVSGIDNLNNAYDVRMKTFRLDGLMQHANFRFIQQDISEKALLDIDTGETPIEAVINLAARAGVRTSVEDPWVYLETNMTGTLNLLELCKRREIGKFILASTSSIYGEDAPLPTPETASSDRPLQPYAATKKGAEAMAHAYHFLNGIDVSIVRFFTVYGPAGRPDMSIFRFIRWIEEGEGLRLNGDGKQTRGFTYVDDIARGVILALKPVGFEIFNLGGHEEISMIDLIGLIETKLDKQAQIEFHPFPAADMRSNRASIEKAGSHLGWEPRIGLSEGLDRAIAWYRAEQEWASKLDVG